MPINLYTINMSHILNNPIKTLLEQVTINPHKDIRSGIEKEGLRVTPEGKLSQKPHPITLGSKLTHPYITTDYSEALLELITSPFHHPQSALTCLEQVHQFISRQLTDEFIWALSMPCDLKSDADIPIADYGISNTGRMKTIYREGLYYRYGKRMQTIAGLHFNMSYSDAFWTRYQNLLNDKQDLQTFKNQAYMGLIRNFMRYSGLVIYLTGASTALCKSFLSHPHNALKTLSSDTLYAPYATSLRMSDLGYHRTNAFFASYNSLQGYIDDLLYATSTPFPDFTAIGVKKEGTYLQLNDHLLQIEAEYYAPIRPKQKTQENERITHALQRRGIEYIEVRALDINPFEPAGISLNQMYFLHVFITYCLLKPSPAIDKEEENQINQTLNTVALEGRKSDLTVMINKKAEEFSEWSKHVVHSLLEIAALFDQELPEKPYQKAIEHYYEMLTNPDQLPSYRLLEAIKDNEGSFLQFGIETSLKYKNYFISYPLSAAIEKKMVQEATDSINKQKQIEASDQISFEAFLAAYFAKK